MKVLHLCIALALTLQLGATAASETNRASKPHELASLIKWAMPNATAGGRLTAPSLQNYNRFKGPIRDIERTSRGYSARAAVQFDGVPAIAENIQDRTDWVVRIEGPNAGADFIAFTADQGMNPAVKLSGPQYLRRHGIDVFNLGCFSHGETATNAEALYLIRATGKTPVLMSYQVSTGSAGVFETYALYFGPIPWSEVPGTGPTFSGARQGFAECRMPSLL
jgi:hypothetical protein